MEKIIFEYIEEQFKEQQNIIQQNKKALEAKAHSQHETLASMVKMLNEEREKLAAQWAKMEFKIAVEYTPEERETALEKLADAAGKFDPASPGGITTLIILNNFY